jgi:hypothetical protein
MSFKTKRNVLIIVTLFLILYIVSFGPVIRYSANAPYILWRATEIIYFPHFVVCLHSKAYNDYLDHCIFMAQHGGLEYPPRSCSKSMCDKTENSCKCGNKSGEERAIYSAVFDSLFDPKKEKGPVIICDSLMIRGGRYNGNIMKWEDRPHSINKNMMQRLSRANCCPCALDTTDISCRIPITFCRYDDISIVKIYDPATNQYIPFETFIRKYARSGIPKDLLKKYNKDTVYVVLSKIALMKNKREGLVCARKYYNRPNYFAEYIFLLEKRPEKWYVKAKWTLFDYNNSQQMVKL